MATGIMAKRIVELRKVRNWTQLDLAKMVGVSENTVGHWEQGRHDPDLGLVGKLSDVFEISTDVLFGREPQLKSFKGADELGFRGRRFIQLVIDAYLRVHKTSK